ncbi:MAG TPA: GAF domain-containing protein, partial [Phycisphaerales bacterium]|nr:GAF domain-containing protein [Phycisphaerales bacterium]
MSNDTRQRRVRALVRELNRRRKKQALRTDILCNDLLAAQRAFVAQLREIAFAAAFYKALVAPSDLHELLTTAAGLIRQQWPACGAAFFLRDEHGEQVTVFDSGRAVDPIRDCLDACFNGRLIDRVCTAGKPCTLDDLYELGMSTEPRWLKGISAVAVPLVRPSERIGFIFLYTPMDQPLTPRQITALANLAPTLARAIQ